MKLLISSKEQIEGQGCRYFYNTSEENAELLSSSFNWIKTEEVKNVGHDYELMAKDALQYFQKN